MLIASAGGKCADFYMLQGLYSDTVQYKVVDGVT